VREISTSVRIRSTPDRVWSALIDFPRYPDCNPFIRSITGTPRVGERLRVELQRDGGGTVSFHPRVLEVRPEAELRWLGRLGIPGLFDGEHRFRLADEGDGTTFTQSERFGGLLVPLLWRRLGPETRRMFERMNEQLRAWVESAGK